MTVATPPSPTPWHALTPDAALEQQGVTVETGLTSAEADARRSARFDNLRFDEDGRLWVAAMDDGVHCYDPDGTLIRRLVVPEAVSNIAWGGPKRNRLFLTAETSLYSVVMAVTGLHPSGPGRRPEQALRRQSSSPGT